MYTRCPECQTTFAVKPAQLEARDGMVRCGRCSTVFQAQEHRVEALTDGDTAETAPDEAGKTRPAARKGTKTKKGTGRKTRKSAGKTVKTGDEAPVSPVQFTLPLAGTAETPHTRMPFLLAGNLLLLLLLSTQAVIFYGGQLAQNFPATQPVLSGICHVVGCQLTPLQDINLIDLVEARVAPHPKFDKALRIRATLVNRAGFNQPYPVMEVTLSDNNGQVIARRSFRPEEYLEKLHEDRRGMPQNVAVSVLLDVTHPNNRALGYEIRLLPAT
jgi:predicted Zn finger-like uncharacterized protein